MAEIAAARDKWDDVMTDASACIEQSRARGRGKYEALGLATRARARHARGHTHAALDELDQAAQFAVTIGDPALELRILATRLAIAPTERVALRAATLVTNIEREIPEVRLAAAFSNADIVQLVRRLAPSVSL